MFFRHMDGLTISRATTGKTVRGRPRSSVTVYVFDSVECKHVSICKTFAKHCVHCRCLKVCDYFDIAFRYIYLFTIWTMCNLMPLCPRTFQGLEAVELVEGAGNVEFRKRHPWVNIERFTIKFISYMTYMTCQAGGHVAICAIGRTNSGAPRRAVSRTTAPKRRRPLDSAWKSRERVKLHISKRSTFFFWEHTNALYDTCMSVVVQGQMFFPPTHYTSVENHLNSLWACSS